VTYTSLVNTFDTYVSVVDQSVNTFTIIWNLCSEK